MNENAVIPAHFDDADLEIIGIVGKRTQVF
jgi:hypothetical protein